MSIKPFNEWKEELQEILQSDEIKSFKEFLYSLNDFYHGYLEINYSGWFNQIVEIEIDDNYFPTEKPIYFNEFAKNIRLIIFGYYLSVELIHDLFYNLNAEYLINYVKNQYLEIEKQLTTLNHKIYDAIGNELNFGDRVLIPDIHNNLTEAILTSRSIDKRHMFLFYFVDSPETFLCGIADKNNNIFNVIKLDNKMIEQLNTFKVMNNLKS